MKIRKGDRVKVIAGRSKGKVGDVLRVLPTEQRVVVQGVNVIKRHTKPGRVLFELDGVPAAVAKEALALAAAKLPIKTRFVARVGTEG